jgi:hypothetical protein
MKSFWNRKKTEASLAAKGHHVYIAPAGAGKWIVQMAGSYDTQGAAILVGRFIASSLDLELQIRGTDGRIRESDSHGDSESPAPG